MKSHVIALAAASALSGTVFAQTSLQIYGLVDAGIVHERGGPAGSVTSLSGGAQSGSRIGFRGTEDLGAGLKARFVLESGFGLDDGVQRQEGRLFGRQAYVGLGGNWGELTFGRQYSPHYLLLDQIDPFSTGLAGNSMNLMTTVQRMDNTVKVSTPAWGGFTGELAYGFGEVPGDSTANRHMGASVGYASGPLLVRFAHHSADDPTGADRARTSLLAGRFDFGMAAASIGVNVNKGTGVTDSRDYLVGVTVPMGPGSLLASYIRTDDRTGINADADQWSVGYTHPISRRTNLYTSFARISNDPGATYTVGNASDAGSGDKAFNVGVRHKF